MRVGMYVCYKPYRGSRVDRSIGVVMEVASDGSCLVEWDDGYKTWYASRALTKV